MSRLSTQHAAPVMSLAFGVALSMKTSFCGPLVAQTSVGRLAQPCGEDVAAQRKAPANGPVQIRLSRSVVALGSACHAGGRGFESRRSRLSVCPANDVFRCLARHVAGD